jgi:DNA-binding LacI/PurR family transcriptional regulator
VDASVDGILAASSLRIESDRARLVYVHDSPRGEECVASDPTSAGRLAADLLSESGYDRIALVTSPNPTDAVATRTRSAKARLRSQGIECDLTTAPYDQQAARDAVAAYLFRHRRSVGLLCITDDHAVGAIAGVHEAGWSVPDDVGPVSVDGTQTTDATRPRITSVAFPIVEMGQLAVAVCKGESQVLKERLPQYGPFSADPR